MLVRQAMGLAEIFFAAEIRIPEIICHDDHDVWRGAVAAAPQPVPDSRTVKQLNATDRINSRRTQRCRNASASDDSEWREQPVSSMTHLATNTQD